MLPRDLVKIQILIQQVLGGSLGIYISGNFQADVHAAHLQVQYPTTKHLRKWEQRMWRKINDQKP